MPGAESLAAAPATGRRRRRAPLLALLAGVGARLLAASPGVAADPGPAVSWRFAVAGDSRNCGDVVMPAIARLAAAQKDLAFYWHLGDFRLGSGIDEDMQAEYGKSLTLDAYRRIAWGDFIAHQVAPFGTLPVLLGIGNHELYMSQDPLLSNNQNVERSRADFLAQFAYWLDSPRIHQSRAGNDGTVKTYYHWNERQTVDFIYLDNAGDEAFDDEQLLWLKDLLEHDRQDPNVRGIVVGMHRALPNSLACGHSMNGDADNPSAHGTRSGRIAYAMFAQFAQDTHKAVYLLASHSHFFMANVFNTPYWSHREQVLPGWIVGTAGAHRYALPDGLPPSTVAKTRVYGYLLGTVKTDASITFELIEATVDDVPPEVVKRYGKELVQRCFAENYDTKSHPPAPSCQEQ